MSGSRREFEEGERTPFLLEFAEIKKNQYSDLPEKWIDCYYIIMKRIGPPSGKKILDPRIKVYQ